MPRDRAAFLWRAVFAVVGWAALALKFWLMARSLPEVNLFALTLRYFSFFTILGTVLVVMALTAPVVAPNTRLGRRAEAPGVRSAVAMYITVVAVAYHFLLSSPWVPVTLDVVATVLLHYVLPAAYILDWLMFTPKGTLTWSDPVKWLSFPAAYGVWTVLHGYATGFWPYWFVNVPQLGLARTVFWSASLLLFFLGAGVALVLIDRYALGRDRRARAA